MRERAADAISGVLEQNVRLFAPHHEHAGSRTSRSRTSGATFERPISSRNLANQVEDEVVDALIQAVGDGLSRASRTATTR